MTFKSFTEKLGHRISEGLNLGEFIEKATARGAEMQNLRIASASGSLWSWWSRGSGFLLLLAALGLPTCLGRAQNAPNAPGAPAREVISVRTIGPVIESVLTSDALLGRRRIAIDTTKKQMSLDLKPAPLEFVGNAKLAMTASLEAAIRIEAIRRDLNDLLPNETFWIRPVAEVETSVDAALADAERAVERRGARDGPQNQVFDEAFERLGESLIKYAQQKRLGIIETREPAAGFAVTVKFDPHPVRVVIMPMLAYLLAKKYSSPLDEQWVEITGGPTKMCGQYHYKAFWPASLNGTVEANFEVFEDGDVVTFRPGVSK